MNKYISTLIILATLLFAGNSLTFTPLSVPANGFYVADQTGKMTDTQIQALNQKIEHLNQSTHNEFAVVLLSDLQGADIETAANQTFRTWSVGKRGLNNGVLIMVALKERKSRIETGKGVEGEITDLQANDILTKNLNPYLKRGDFAGGFNAALDATSNLLESRYQTKATPVPSAYDQKTGHIIFAVSLVIFLIIAIIGLFIWLSEMDKREKELMENEIKQREDLREMERKREIYATTTIPVSSGTIIPIASAAVIGTALSAPTTTNHSSEHERAAKKRRDEQEETDRRRRNEESSSSSSFGSSSSGSDSGGGFGGGDSGGGGSSSFGKI